MFNKDKKFLYHFVIGFLVIALAVMATVSNYVFQTQQAALDSYIASMEEERRECTLSLEKVQDMYNSLDASYLALQTEYDRLSSCVLPVYRYDESDIELLARCVQSEAGIATDTSSDLEQKYITQVVLNRVSSRKFPDSISEVIYQSGQFDVVTNGSIDSCVVVDSTLCNVYSVLLFGSSLPSYVTYFYATYSEEPWITSLEKYDTVSGTVFAYT